MTVATLIKRALSVPKAVSAVAKGFMDDLGLKGTPEVSYTPTALTLTFPNWTGTERDLERAVEVERHYPPQPLEGRLKEALDMEDHVIDGYPEISVRGTDAVVKFPLRPYDPDEDSPL